MTKLSGTRTRQVFGDDIVLHVSNTHDLVLFEHEKRIGSLPDGISYSLGRDMMIAHSYVSRFYAETILTNLAMHRVGRVPAASTKYCSICQKACHFGQEGTPSLRRDPAEGMPF